MKAKAVLTVFLIIVGMFTFLAPVPVHAAGPVIVQKVVCGNDGSATSVTCILNGVSGSDWIVVGTGSAASGSVTVSDNAGASNYTLDVAQASGGSGKAIVWHRAGGASGSVTFTISVTGAAATLGGFVYEVSGLSQLLQTAVGVCTVACTTSINTATSIAATGNFVVASIYHNGLNSGDSSSCCTVDTVAGGNSGPVFLSSTTAAGNINFPITVGSAPSLWTEAGATFGVTTVVFTVVACTFFQLQCWWYPLFLMSLYAGFLLLVGTFLRVSPRGKAHIFLSALTFASLVAVVLGVMNIVFPLMLIIVNTLIALRLRG